MLLLLTLASRYQGWSQLGPRGFILALLHGKLHYLYKIKIIFNVNVDVEPPLASLYV